MTVFNPLTAILTQNKLEGSNYVDWKRNLDIVLIAEEYKFVLDEVCPKKPGDDATDDEQKAYQKWVKTDEMARCYILVSMSNILQHQHQSMESAYDILENLKEVFGDQNRAAKQTAMKALLNTKMVEGSSVRGRVLKMMSLLNELEVLGANIDKDTQVKMIVQTLPDNFQQFRLNYNMNKIDLSLVKLLNELQSAETIIKQQAPRVTLNFEVGSSFKPRGEQKKKKAQKPYVGGATAGVKRARGKCYHCKKHGHHKKQCPAYLAKLNNKPGDLHLLVIETLLAVVSTTSWCVDSGATNHVCTYLQGFQVMRRLSRGEINIYQADGSAAPALALGNISILFGSDRILALKDTLYVPSVRRNLISVSSAMKAGYDINFHDIDKCIIYKKKRGVDENVQTFKARLVGKGFTKKEEIDYEENFSSVAMFKSIRILLSIAAHYDYEIWQMDVKTAFLNRSLDECIYMMQPDSFVESGKEHMLCKIKRFSMHDSKKGFLPFRHGISLSKDQSPKTDEEIEKMKAVLYASAVGSLMTRDYVLVNHSDDLVPIGYTDSDFQSDRDSRKSTSGNVFTLGGEAISWRSIKQTCVADSTMEVEYVAAKEAVWLGNFLRELAVIPSIQASITLYCDNSGAVVNSKESRSHKRAKHIECKYHLIHEIVQRGDVVVTKIASENNLADPFTKSLPQKTFDRHVDGMGVRIIDAWL
ncbi:uncharacterized protein LOC142178077 [Nicotiana tabacum]|uniref:Uncharacterized protein LOC142178077 n=1 Tax=Nicotiana tabacum TaxID=4097 RepID=A0AC58U1Z8_TOBAC